MPKDAVRRNDIYICGCPGSACNRIVSIMHDKVTRARVAHKIYAPSFLQYPLVRGITAKNVNAPPATGLHCCIPQGHRRYREFVLSRKEASKFPGRAWKPALHTAFAISRSKSRRENTRLRKYVEVYNIKHLIGPLCSSWESRFAQLVSSLLLIVPTPTIDTAFSSQRCPQREMIESSLCIRLIIAI